MYPSVQHLPRECCDEVDMHPKEQSTWIKDRPSSWRNAWSEELQACMLHLLINEACHLQVSDKAAKESLLTKGKEAKPVAQQPADHPSTFMGEIFKCNGVSHVPA